jgi:hypothetical protein
MVQDRNSAVNRIVNVGVAPVSSRVRTTRSKTNEHLAAIASMKLVPDQLLERVKVLLSSRKDGGDRG